MNLGSFVFLGMDAARESAHSRLPVPGAAGGTAADNQWLEHWERIEGVSRHDHRTPVSHPFL